MFQIDVMSRKPVYEQLVEQVERFVLIGLLAPGEQLPSVRSLSVELSINPNTIQKAYSELDRKGLLFSVPGKGCFVSSNLEDVLGKHRHKKLQTLRTLTEELKQAGVEKTEVLEIIQEVYN
jgi:GntR family transcriptional regulator